MSASRAGYLLFKAGENVPRKLLNAFPGRSQDVLLSLELSSDIVRSFSLCYDFVDFIVVNPDNLTGMEAPDIPDVKSLLDEVLNLRLCYEMYTPVFVRLSPRRTPEEMDEMLHFCLLNGVDGLFVNSVKQLHAVQDMIGNRLPLVLTTDSTNPSEIVSMYREGASLVECNVRPHVLKKIHKLLEQSEIQ